MLSTFLIRIWKHLLVVLLVSSPGCTLLLLDSSWVDSIDPVTLNGDKAVLEKMDRWTLFVFIYNIKTHCCIGSERSERFQQSVTSSQWFGNDAPHQASLTFSAFTAPLMTENCCWGRAEHNPEIRYPPWRAKLWNHVSFKSPFIPLFSCWRLLCNN